jgi:solute carrier family 25 folate transporter 32
MGTEVETGQSEWGRSFRILRQITRDEGSYGALYRGLMPNMIGNSISWALYFLWWGVFSNNNTLGTHT